MGTVSGELRRAALRAGAEILTGADASAVDPDGSVRYRRGDDEQELAAHWVLAGCSPTELARLLGDEPPPSPEGAQIKVNLLLHRLPRLRDASVDPRAAFGGTFHVNETWTQLQTAYDRADGGSVPEPLPPRDLLPLAHRPDDPLRGAAGRRRADAHRVRAAQPAPARADPDARRRDRRRPLPGDTRGGRDREPELGARRADRGPPARRRGRPADDRDEDDARPRALASTPGREHLPRRPRVALGGGRRTARHPPRSAGASRPRTSGSSSAAPARVAAAPSRRSAGTTPRWPSSSRSSRSSPGDAKGRSRRTGPRASDQRVL